MACGCFGFMAILTCPDGGLRLLRGYGYFDLSGSMAVFGLLTFLAVLDLSSFWSRLAWVRVINLIEC